jgi:hypothetical protein
LLAYARSLRAFSHDFPRSRTFDFRKTIMRKQEHVLEKIMLKHDVQQQSGRWA